MGIDKRKELVEEELQNVVGGQLNDEATTWLTSNMSVIKQRLTDDHYNGHWQPAGLQQMVGNSKKTYTLNDLKNYFRGINVYIDDLN